MISVTEPAPMVRPPSRMANLKPISMAIGVINAISRLALSPGITISTPDGNVTLTVPKRAQSGQVARLRGRGVKRKNQSGDLFVRFFIRLPEAENDEIEDAVDTLAEATTADIRAGIVF